MTRTIPHPHDPPSTHHAVRSQQAAPSIRGTSRLVYLDNLRVLLTFLVVALHAALAFGNVGLWPNWQEPESPLVALPLDIFMALNQSFFMGFFFLLSGFLAPGSVDRKGPGRWGRDRLKRLGLPFLGFVVLLRPLYTLPTFLEQAPADRPPYWRFYLTEWDIGPAWFLEVLLLFALVYALVRHLAPRTPDEPAPRGTSLRWAQILGFVAALAGAYYLWGLVIGTRSYIPIIGLPSPGYLPQYAALFVIGILAFRRGWLRTLPRRAGLLGTALVIGSFIPMVLGGYLTLDLANPLPGAHPAQLAAALWDAMFAVGIILILLRVFQRFADRSSAAAQFLSRNAFAVYLLHAPVIVGIVAVLHPLEATPVVMFLLTFALAAVLSWVLAALVRRVPAVRAVL